MGWGYSTDIFIQVCFLFIFTCSFPCFTSWYFSRTRRNETDRLFSIDGTTNSCNNYRDCRVFYLSWRNLVILYLRLWISSIFGWNDRGYMMSFLYVFSVIHTVH